MLSFCVTADPKSGQTGAHTCFCELYPICMHCFCDICLDITVYYMITHRHLSKVASPATPLPIRFLKARIPRTENTDVCILSFVYCCLGPKSGCYRASRTNIFKLLIPPPGRRNLRSPLLSKWTGPRIHTPSGLRHPQIREGQMAAAG